MAVLPTITVRVPAVGDDVHYVAFGTPAGAHRAAKITQLDNVGLSEQFIEFPEVSLIVFNPTGLYFNERIPFDPNGAPGTWHWPEPVPPIEISVVFPT